mmetsp:Transcript_2792/g.3191  ORF Transcript_2792/g.3191 Transcript_2792/m.3191 type:complete len:320 (+) Transcript_2792:97-1056(+)|eukprot:CAMPEP_0195290966 /NCGR_PEP_ID=MMETSP0707-20130614/6802_1 /TAXON_ID=33640 /ORGANISM="Asterionellopsis glacialis, Strain CCMP134" /LENGTH=319 /DNA_ID=CAMNT_0040351171 /DNA_START=70 /DNA_END=1029 /DNA_ORIENTATION=+
MSPSPEQNENSLCHTEENISHEREHKENRHEVNALSLQEVIENGDSSQSRKIEEEKATDDGNNILETKIENSTKELDLLKAALLRSAEEDGGDKLEESQDDEWSDLWDSTTKKTSNSSPEETIKRNASAAGLRTSVGSFSSFSRPPSRLNNGVMDDLRKELGHHRRKVHIGEQSAKRRKANDGEVSDLIARMSSSNLLRTSPSGRLIGESARQKIAGATNATFGNVQTPANRFGSRAQLAPFGSKAHLDSLSSKAILSGLGSRAALNGSSSNARFDLVRPSSSSNSGGSSNAKFDLVRPGRSMGSSANPLSSKANLLGA